MNDLLRKLSDGTLTTDEAKELNELLRGNPEACEVYLNHIALEAQLERELQQPAKMAQIRRISPIRHIRPILAAAAAIVLAFILWPSSSIEAPLATVLLSEDCVWKGQKSLPEGSRLAPGKIQLSSGTAILRFDGGAEAVLRGETTLELLSAVRARLIAGEIVIRAEGDAAGFKLLTPASELTDLGTEFAVKVQRSGITELQVLDGQVGYGDATEVDGGHAADKCFFTAAPHPTRGGFRNTISLDQLASQHIGHLTRFPSLTLVIGPGNTSLSWTPTACRFPARIVPRSSLSVCSSKVAKPRSKRRFSVSKKVAASWTPLPTALDRCNATSAHATKNGSINTSQPCGTSRSVSPSPKPGKPNPSPKCPPRLLPII